MDTCEEQVGNEREEWGVGGAKGMRQEGRKRVARYRGEGEEGAGGETACVGQVEKGAVLRVGLDVDGVGHESGGGAKSDQMRLGIFEIR